MKFWKYPEAFIQGGNLKFAAKKGRSNTITGKNAAKSDIISLLMTRRRRTRKRQVWQRRAPTAKSRTSFIASRRSRAGPRAADMAAVSLATLCCSTAGARETSGSAVATRMKTTNCVPSASGSSLAKETARRRAYGSSSSTY